MTILVKRVITGLVFGAVVLGSILIHWLAFAAVLSLFLVFAIDEWVQLGRKFSFDLSHGIVFFSVISAFITFVFYRLDVFSTLYLALLWILIPLIILFEMVRKSKSKVINIVMTIGGVLYLSVPFGLMLFLFGDFGLRSYQLLFFLFGVIWSYDTFAYFSGMLFGKHKLCEQISPKKTWEGLFGGVVMTALIFIILALTIFDIDVLKGLIGVFIIIIAATIGDLFESMLKRKADIKDSGTILPGHGGVLDRFDSVFFAAPAFVLYVFLL